MEHTFTKEMLSCDFDHEDALYALFGLPPRTGSDDEECLEFQVEVRLSDLEVQYHDGRGWATDGCCEGYTVTDYQETIEAIFNGKRYSLDTILTKAETKRFLEDAEESVIEECKRSIRYFDY